MNNMNNTLYNSMINRGGDGCLEALLAENDRRKRLHAQPPYDPLTGVGCWGDRVEVDGNLVPRAVVVAHPDYASLDAVTRDRLRIVEDFEFWCARCATIKDKVKCCDVPFIPNAPQRRLLAVMEQQRVARRPIRVMLLKARQWGGSTLVQLYMAWMQLVRHKGWNSLICGHMHQTSKSIKRMYNLLLRHYPPELLDEGARQPQFTKLEGQPNVQQIDSRDCLVITASSRSEDAARGYDISMAHLSEVAFWPSSTMHDPNDVVRSVCGSVVLKPDSVIVMESTANGVGDYFHDEWVRSQAGRSDKQAVFVPWHEIGMYAQDVDDPMALWHEMDEYERDLWDSGCTLEQVNWYHHKRREFHTHERMMAEYPGTAVEAFMATGSCPFAVEHLERMQDRCTALPLLVGDIQGRGLAGAAAKEGIHLVKASNGLLKVWQLPEDRRVVRYMVVVDIGGRSLGSDYSVIAVWRLPSPSSPPAVVAQWRGHIYHDQLAWKAMQLAAFYRNALLVVESNTLTNEAARAGESDYILQAVSRVYGNVYQRERHKLGFHTNVKTKSQAIDTLIAAVRDGTYGEPDIDAVNEMRNYQDLGSGRYAARPGKHDDILMTRAIGLLVMQDERLALSGSTPAPDKSLTADPWLLHYRSGKHFDNGS